MASLGIGGTVLFLLVVVVLSALVGYWLGGYPKFNQPKNDKELNHYRGWSTWEMRDVGDNITVYRRQRFTIEKDGATIHHYIQYSTSPKQLPGPGNDIADNDRRVHGLTNRDFGDLARLLGCTIDLEE